MAVTERKDLSGEEKPMGKENGSDEAARELNIPMVCTYSAGDL
jgi:hypothetical protein